VIGSGPAGAACASALASRGAKVLMLDAGINLEPDRASIVSDLAAQKSSQWPSPKVAAVHGESDANLKGLPNKKIFGSDFPYRDTAGKIPWRGKDVAVFPSLGFGGLSNVWGAAMLPLRDDDLADWPIKNNSLAEHYRAVAEMAGLAGRHDGLEDAFPLHAQNPPSLRPSRQAARFLAGLERRRETLRARGWLFGQSRLAVRAADSPRGIGCVYCGYCMTGCVYGCIYNSAHTVRELQRRENFQYQGDVIVSRLREQPDSIAIDGFQRLTGEPLSFKAERVYLAAGVIPTARIMLRSQEAFDRALTLRDSQYFLFPIVQWRGVRDVHAEALYTLSQAFVELSHPRIGRRPVHLQIYTYSDSIAAAVRRSLGPLKMFARPVLERLLIAQGYLHSGESSAIQMTLRCDGNGREDILELEPLLNPETPPAVRSVLRELQGQFRAMGGFVVPPMLQISRPGRGFHCGGSLPMRAQPGDLETDCLGRPRGWSRLHVVDASVLPTVPATTITFSVMANAHRIGYETAC
ncbi:MAG: GMC oxidoreductase, partial [Limisphaerales bacterium]